MQNGLSHHQTMTVSQNIVTPKEQINQSAGLSGLVAILFPLAIIGTIAGCKKYKATLKQRRIDRLNRIWQLEASRKTP